MSIPNFLDIDPDDNNLIPYGKETFDYYQLRDDHFRLKTDDLLGYQGHLIFERRKRLVEWLIHVAHHNKCSQQTFYHTVDILDRSLSRKKFRPESIQLLGITSFFIASKVYINLFIQYSSSYTEICRIKTKKSCSSSRQYIINRNR